MIFRKKKSDVKKERENLSAFDNVEARLYKRSVA